MSTTTTAVTQWLGAGTAAAVIAAGTGVAAPAARIAVTDLPDDSRRLVTELLTDQARSVGGSLADAFVADYVAALDRTFVAVNEGASGAHLRITGPAVEVDTVLEDSEDGLRFASTDFVDVTI
ncbi:hypothetical protein [Brevibacterium litoralis]|uniref:hypothetical protein n=1 Tax=Brevibacterium litoralis TaxID=3138935 RepID=UPI0032EC8614